MREILFRGKRADNGKWTEGADVMWKTCRGALCLASVGKDWISVDPETLGQYTGGRDKLGNKIFEGDIILVEFEDDDYHFIFSQFEVFFDTERYGWYVRWLNDQNETFCLDEYEGNCKIVGNIHDNPELRGDK